MLDQGLIDGGQYRTATRTPLPRAQDIQHPAVQGQAPYFANYVREQLLATYRRDKVYGGGLKVETTIDLNLQRLARAAVQKWLPSPDGPQAALVALDAHSGAVLAMVGGRNYHESQFNLATQRNRQVGSSFKPLVLATALREGIAPQTTFVSGPVTINADGRLWTVDNYEGESIGTIDLSNAMVHSDNTIFAQLTALVGPKNVAKTAQKLGIAGLKGYFSIGLGGEAVSPVEMARAYAAFANGGYRVDGSITGNRPRVIDCLPAPTGPASRGTTSSRAGCWRRVTRHDRPGPAGRRPVRHGPGRGNPGPADRRQDRDDRGLRRRVVRGLHAADRGRSLGRLSGQARLDATDFHGSPVVGGTYPALIFKSFIERALPLLPSDPESFPQPQSRYIGTQAVVQRAGKLELDNGYCDNARTVAFYGGVPLPTANCKPNEVEVPRVVGQSIDAARARLQAQPLTPAVVYKPATPKQRLGVVLGQFPAGGTLSSYDKVTLVLAKPLHGVVPRLVGLPLRKAEARLRKRHLQASVTGGSTGRIVSQKPAGGVAAAPGMTVTLGRSGRLRKREPASA